MAKYGATHYESKKWIPKKLVKGGLHHDLGIPEGENIPIDEIEAAANKPGRLGRRARFALTMRHLNKKR